jgi:hypothetical protein
MMDIMSITNAMKYRIWSYQLSIAAGILILFSGIALSQWHLALSWDFSWMTGPPKILSSNLDVLTFALILCGVFVTASGILMMKWRPTKMLGITVIIFSALSLTEMGGFFFGGLMGIIGGILAIKTATSKHNTSKL